MKREPDRPKGKDLALIRAKHGKGIEGITMAELSATWSGVVEALEGDELKVINPAHALEGALCIR